MLRGLKKHMKDDGRWTAGFVASICAVDRKGQDQDGDAYLGVEEYWDDTSGKKLDPPLVMGSQS